jgi:hypothetical protein
VQLGNDNGLEIEVIAGLSAVIRTNQVQVWFVAEHLVN